MVIKRVGPVSCAKITGTLYAIIGLVAGLIFSLASLAGAFSARGARAGGMAAIGAGAVIVFPLLYGALGFVGTLIAAWLYNLLARVVGGIQIEVE